ncbi:MAG: prepilin-type N-terminal cleavage/methylation domain-containing protein [bacterium]
MSTPECREKRGFSLVEMLVTILVGAVLMGIVSTNVPRLKKMADKFLNQALYEEQYLVFLLKLEDEYQQSAISNPESVERIGQLIFEQDENLDGDLNDSGERIAYRWNEKEQRIDRKSGSGNYQALLEGITAFSWAQTGDAPVCHQLEIRNVFSPKPRTVVYCMDDSD